MEDLERAISERQQNISRLEKEVSQATERLSRAQHELELLLAARQIVARDGLANELHHHTSAGMAGVNSFRDIYMSRATLKPRHELTLVDEVKEVLSHAPFPIGPAEIRAELSKTGRDVPQNVMTGLLSRLWKENRVIRLERGKYRATTNEDVIDKNETA